MSSVAKLMKSMCDSLRCGNVANDVLSQCGGAYTYKYID